MESGIRLAHALELVAIWNPNEKVYVEPLGKVEERCKCFESHCRCWLGIRRGKKSALWAFMSKETSEALNEIAPMQINQKRVDKVRERLGLIKPSKLRKFFRTVHEGSIC